MPTLSTVHTAPSATRRGSIACWHGADVQHGMFGRRPILPVCVGLIAVTDFIILWWTCFAVANSTSTLPLLPAAAACIALLAAQRMGLYELALLRRPQRCLLRLLLLATIAPALIAAVSGPSETIIIDVVRGFIASVLALGANRTAAAACLQHLAQQGHLDRRAAVYGSPAHCRTLIAALRDDPHKHVRVCALFTDRGTSPGTLGQLVQCVRYNAIDLVIVALPIAAEGRLLDVLDALDPVPVDIRVAAEASTLRLHPRAYSWLGTVPLIDLCDRPLTDWNRCIKGAFDRVMALVALIVLSPLMLILAAIIKIDSKGPVLFRQQRFGLNSEPIDVLKFRSMHAAACDAGAVRLVTRQDARVTRVGRFIRKTSLDELPQLFNVLQGDMSLVGPRPHALQAKAGNRLYHHVVARYFARHRMKPGITGWAQINGWRGETDTAEKIRKRVEHDAYYIENWSLLLDIYILLKTPFVLLQTGNAY